jgi:hypothetical protein
LATTWNQRFEVSQLSDTAKTEKASTKPETNGAQGETTTNANKAQTKPETPKSRAPHAARQSGKKPVATKAKPAKQTVTSAPAKTSKFEALKVTPLVRENQTREGSGAYPRLSLPRIGSRVTGRAESNTLLARPARFC